MTRKVLVGILTVTVLTALLAGASPVWATQCYVKYTVNPPSPYSNFMTLVACLDGTFSLYASSAGNLCSGTGAMLSNSSLETSFTFAPSTQCAAGVYMGGDIFGSGMITCPGPAFLYITGAAANSYRDLQASVDTCP